MVSAPLSADIGSFQQHGSAFWDVQGPYRTLHQINPARLQFVERFVVLSGLRVLDVGCGGNTFAGGWKRRSRSPTGRRSLPCKPQKTCGRSASSATMA